MIKFRASVVALAIAAGIGSGIILPAIATAAPTTASQASNSENESGGRHSCPDWVNRPCHRTDNR